MERPAALVLALALVAPAAAGCASSKGEVSAADRAAIKQANDDAESLFQRGVRLRGEGKWSDARKAFTAVYEDYAASPLAGEAQFQAAECAYGDERYYAAGHAFAKYVEDRPLSPHVDVVEKRMYAIGDYLIVAGKRGLWGLGIFTSSEEGIEILQRQTALLPTGSLADDALLRMARWYAEERDFAGVETTLQGLLQNYPDSEWRLEARFLLAWGYRQDNRGPEYDGERLRRARASYMAFLEDASSTPDRATEHRDRIAAAKAEVAAIDADFARKALARARLYRRMDRPRAALAVLERAAREQGGTEPGRLAGEEARRLGEALRGAGR